MKLFNDLLFKFEKLKKYKINTELISKNEVCI